jgi:uncharacterized membrane protein
MLRNRVPRGSGVFAVTVVVSLSLTAAEFFAAQQSTLLPLALCRVLAAPSAKASKKAKARKKRKKARREG